MEQPHLINVETKETTIESNDTSDLKINRIVTPISLVDSGCVKIVVECMKLFL